MGKTNQQGTSKQIDIPRLCWQIAVELDECCLLIDESGRKSKNLRFKFPGVIDRTNNVKDAELFDIDTDKLFYILDVELKEALTKLRHYSPANAQELESKFKQIKRWAIQLDMSSPRPSTTRLPRMADYPSEVIANIGYLTFHLPEQANELGRVAELLKENQNNKPAKREQKIDPQGKGGQSGNEIRDIQKRFTFNKAQAFFDKKDLGLPTGAEVNPAGILNKLVKSFGRVVPYADLDENSGDTASDFLRGKIRVVKHALKKHKVPCKIESKRWAGYILSSSRTHS